MTDGAWAVGTQTVLVDNVMINSTTYTFEGRGQDEGDNNDENGGEGGDG